MSDAPTPIRPPYTDADIDALQTMAHDYSARLQEIADELARRARLAVKELDDDNADAAARALAEIESLRHDDRPATG